MPEPGLYVVNATGELAVVHSEGGDGDIALLREYARENLPGHQLVPVGDVGMRCPDCGHVPLEDGEVNDVPAANPDVDLYCPGCGEAFSLEAVSDV